VTTFSQPSPSTQSYHSHTFGVSHPTPQRAQPARLDGNGSAHTYSYGSVSRPYAGRGWIEQALPHGARYFVNPRIQATTDVDLRNLSKLEAVMSVVEMAGSAPEGCEMWAREGPVVKRGWRRQKMIVGPVISWIDHRIRRVSSEIPSVDGIIFSGEDDSQWCLFIYNLLADKSTQDLMTSTDTGHLWRLIPRIFRCRRVLDRKLWTHFIGPIQTHYWHILSRSPHHSPKTSAESC
jgi:hypothetical protein